MTDRFTFSKRWRDSLSDYVTSIAWSSDGGTLAVTSAAGEVALFGSNQDRVTLQPSQRSAMTAVGFSPDSNYVAAAGQDGTVTAWLLEPEYPLAFEQTHPGAWLDQLAWHPRRPHLAYSAGPRVQVWDVADKSQVAELDFEASSALHLAWHPTGERLAVCGHGGIKVWDEDWGAAPESIAVPGASLHAAWSTDGKYLGSGNLDRTLTVAEWDSPPPWLMQGFPGKVRQVAWSDASSPSDQPLLAAACAEGITLWRQEESDRAWKSQVLRYHQGRVNAIAFQPQTTRLASAGEDGCVCIWDGDKAPAKVLKFGQGCSTLAWHPSGQQLAIAGTYGAVGVWGLHMRQKKGFG